MAKENVLIVLAQSLEQPRVIKRVIEKSILFDRLDLYGFSRAIHEVNNFEKLKEYKNIRLYNVGTLTNSKYFGRVNCYLNLIKMIYLHYGFSKKNIYVFGLDTRIISVLLINSKIDYEISDIMWLYKKPLHKKILSIIDTFLSSYSNKVIFTSKGFYETYYKQYVKPSNAIIVENKFKTYGKVAPVIDLKKDLIRIAYIGAFRYHGIIKNLISAVSKNPNLVLNFYGDGFSTMVKEMKQQAAIINNINFHGPFKNPDHLERIYQENNVNFVVYDNTLENEKVAMPNKFYESGYFNIPILAANKTYVGQRVIENKMGWTIGISEEEISAFFSSLKIEEIIQCHEHIKKLDKTLFEA